MSPTGSARASSPPAPDEGVAAAPAALAPDAPNIFIYNLDDLRDAFPGAIDPLRFMPKTRQWMAAGTRFMNSFVAIPSCCPSRSALMTGRYPHNNGIRLQSQGPNLDSGRSMACYLRDAGYATYVVGKFLTSWPLAQRPPCFDRWTTITGGYNDVSANVNGTVRLTAGYSTTMLGARGREYVVQALGTGTPFLLYETPQAPHWVNTTVDGVATRLAIPDQPYRSAAVGTCSGVPEPNRDDKPQYVRRMNFSVAQGQAMCESQMRAIMSADDEFAATMQLLSNRGVLADTLVILTSDNGYMWGEHGRTEKFVPYEPSIRVPLLIRWPGRIPSSTNWTRMVSNVDVLPTLLEAAGITPPAGSPPLDGESLLRPTSRTAVFAEYFADTANGQINGVPTVSTWRMVRQRGVKFVQTYGPGGAVTFREYYDLRADPAENTNLLADGVAGNDPPAAEIGRLTNLLNALAGCAGQACVR